MTALCQTISLNILYHFVFSLQVWAFQASWVHGFYSKPFRFLRRHFYSVMWQVESTNVQLSLLREQLGHGCDIFLHLLARMYLQLECFC